VNRAEQYDQAIELVNSLTPREAILFAHYMSGLNPELVIEFGQCETFTTLRRSAEREVAMAVGVAARTCLGRDMDCGRSLPCPDHPDLPDLSERGVMNEYCEGCGGYRSVDHCHTTTREGAST
jgi:TPP-dependent indolepyruvate ferredoxin oxidoreductase alpha subunit